MRVDDVATWSAVIQETRRDQIKHWQKLLKSGSFSHGSVCFSILIDQQEVWEAVYGWEGASGRIWPNQRLARSLRGIWEWVFDQIDQIKQWQKALHMGVGEKSFTHGSGRGKNYSWEWEKKTLHSGRRKNFTHGSGRKKLHMGAFCALGSLYTRCGSLWE